MVQDEEEGDSEASSRDSATTSTDIDPMDDTLASQQTAATETSQPGQSAVNIVSKTNLTARNQMLIDFSVWKGFAFDCNLRCSRSRQIRQTCLCHNYVYLRKLLTASI